MQTAVRFLPVAAIQLESARVSSTVISGSTSTASSLPWISVAEMGENMRLGMPRGRSSLTTGFDGATNTSYFSFALLIAASCGLLAPGLEDDQSSCPLRKKV